MKESITIEKEALIELLKSCWQKGYDQCWMTQQAIRDTAVPNMEELFKNKLATTEGV